MIRFLGTRGEEAPRLGITGGRCPPRGLQQQVQRGVVDGDRRVEPVGAEPLREQRVDAAARQWNVSHVRVEPVGSRAYSDSSVLGGAFPRQENTGAFEVDGDYPHRYRLARVGTWTRDRPGERDEPSTQWAMRTKNPIGAIFVTRPVTTSPTRSVVQGEEDARGCLPTTSPAIEIPAGRQRTVSRQTAAAPAVRRLTSSDGQEYSLMC